jgi:hypothetical protein
MYALALNMKKYNRNRPYCDCFQLDSPFIAAQQGVLTVRRCRRKDGRSRSARDFS